MTDEFPSALKALLYKKRTPLGRERVDCHCRHHVMTIEDVHHTKDSNTVPVFREATARERHMLQGRGPSGQRLAE